MLKRTLIAAATVSLMAFGATAAYAGKGDGGGGGHGGGGGGHGGGHHGGGHHGGGHHGGGHHGNKHGGHGWKHRYPPLWLNYSWYPRCHYETRKVRIKAWDRRGRLYHKWVFRDVKVCD